MRVTKRATALLAAALMLLNLPDADSQAYAGRSADDKTDGIILRRPSSVNYHPEDHRFLEINDPTGQYIRIMLPGHHLTQEAGKPELPVWSRLVEVPDGMDLVVSLSDVVSERIRFEDHGAPGLNSSRHSRQGQKTSLSRIKSLSRTGRHMKPGKS